MPPGSRNTNLQSVLYHKVFLAYLINGEPCYDFIYYQGYVYNIEGNHWHLIKFCFLKVSLFLCLPLSLCFSVPVSLHDICVVHMFLYIMYVYCEDTLKCVQKSKVRFRIHFPSLSTFLFKIIYWIIHLFIWNRIFFLNPKLTTGNNDWSVNSSILLSLPSLKICEC